MDNSRVPYFVKSRAEFIELLTEIIDKATKLSTVIIVGSDQSLSVDMLFDRCEMIFKQYLSTGEAAETMLKRTRVKTRASLIQQDRHGEKRRVAMERAGKLAQYLHNFIIEAESIEERLQSEYDPDNQAEPLNPTTNSVFIVHGHDNEMKQEVARFIERLDIEAIVLHERPSKGSHILTKLVHEGDRTGYAIILCSPDDEGRKRGLDEETGNEFPLQERPRQNVVLELGYFIGRFGPEGVTALIKGKMEMPGDFDGVVYTPMDEFGGWKIAIANELSARGFMIDKNKI